MDLNPSLANFLSTQNSWWLLSGGEDLGDHVQFLFKALCSRCHSSGVSFIDDILLLHRRCLCLSEV